VEPADRLGAKPRACRADRRQQARLRSGAAARSRIRVAETLAGEQVHRATDPYLDRARVYLRSVQAAKASGFDEHPGETADVVAHKAADAREANAMQSGGKFHMSGFSYDAHTEKARFGRTHEIITRVVPGPFEDGEYFELLARQAASIELYLAATTRDPAQLSALSRVLIGTIATTQVHATTTLVGNVPIIMLSPGTIYTCYELSKAVALSWRIIQGGKPQDSRVAFASDIDDIRKFLNKHDQPVRTVTETIINWLLEGLPRPNYSRPVPANRTPLLTLLINGAERFILSHEYAHVLFDHLRILLPDPEGLDPLTSPQDKEFRADGLAVRVTADSAAMLDRLPPNIALQGALLAMKAADVARRVKAIARGGVIEDEPLTHPPFADRVAVFVDTYQQGYAQHGDGRAEVAGMLGAAETVEELWTRSEPHIMALLKKGAPLHPIWSG
jgi:hypothetical protein